MAVINRDVCLYRHVRLDKNETFYIGIGNKRRPYATHDRSDFWKKITNKSAYEVEVLQRNLTWEEACELEVILIEFFGRKDLNKGSLCNLTDGGEGRYGGVVSKSTRLKQSKTRRGRKQTREWINNRAQSLKGKPLSKEHKLKLRKAKLGKTLSEEHRQRISLSNILTSKKGRSKQVIDEVTGQVFRNIREAADNCNLSYTALKAQLNGQNKNSTNLKIISNECN